MGWEETSTVDFIVDVHGVCEEIEVCVHTYLGIID